MLSDHFGLLSFQCYSFPEVILGNHVRPSQCFSRFGKSQSSKGASQCSPAHTQLLKSRQLSALVQLTPRLPFAGCAIPLSLKCIINIFQADTYLNPTWAHLRILAHLGMFNTGGVHVFAGYLPKESGPPGKVEMFVLEQ